MAGLGKKQGVCFDIPLRRVEAFSEVVSEQVVERIGPVYKLLLLLLLNYSILLKEYYCWGGLTMPLAFGLGKTYTFYVSSRLA